LLIENKSNTLPAEIPQLDQLFVKAVSEDLRKKLLSHLHLQPSTTTNNANTQQFSEMTQTAIDAENELQTISNICLWTTVDKQLQERQAEKMKGRMNNIGWKTASGQIRNKQHDGHLEGKSKCLIAANRQIVNRLPEQFAESNDGCHHFEQILDLGN
jgi:hypothetical protein